MIRILHVVTLMEVGGIETMIMNLYREIDRDKIQFDFLVHRLKKGFYENEILNLGGQIYRVPPIGLKTLNKYLKELRSFFRNHREYRIVHSHISVNSYLILKKAKEFGIPVRIAHSHESHKSIREHKIFRRPIILYSKYMINNQVTHRFSCSDDAGIWLFGRKVDFKVINNGIDASKYCYNQNVRMLKRNEFKIKSDEFVIGHIGNFSKAKNYPLIIEVFKNVLALKKNSKLVLVGNHKKDPSFESKLIEAGLRENVLLTGVRSDVPDLLQAMDILLFPSFHEGLPVTLIEAQASGLRCIISDSITDEVKITEYVDFIPLDKPVAYWSDQILRYADGYDRRDTSKDILKAGYDVRENAKWLEEFYIEQYYNCK